MTVLVLHAIYTSKFIIILADDSFLFCILFKQLHTLYDSAFYFHKCVQGVSSLADKVIIESPCGFISMDSCLKENLLNFS